MKKSLVSLTAVVILATMAGCSNEENGGMPDPDGKNSLITFSQPVTINHNGEETKAAIPGTTLPANGTLGVYAYNTGSVASGDVYISNQTLDYATPNGNSLYSYFGSTEYFWPGTQALDFYAYFYPSGSGGITVNGVENISYTLQGSWTNQVDLLYTKTTNKTKATVPLAFDHAMSWVRFNIKSTTNKGAVLQAIKFNNNTVGTFSLKDGVFTATNTPGDITVTGSTSADISTGDASTTDYINSLVFPTTAWAPSVTATINGKEFAAVQLSAITLEARHVYTFTINYTGTVIEFSEPTVSEWTYTSGSVEVPVE